MITMNISRLDLIGLHDDTGEIDDVKLKVYNSRFNFFYYYSYSSRNVVNKYTNF